MTFFLYKKTNSLFQIMLLIIYILTQLILFVKLINKKKRENKKFNFKVFNNKNNELRVKIFQIYTYIYNIIF